VETTKTFRYTVALQRERNGPMSFPQASLGEERAGPSFSGVSGNLWFFEIFGAKLRSAE